MVLTKISESGKTWVPSRYCCPGYYTYNADIELPEKTLSPVHSQTTTTLGLRKWDRVRLGTSHIPKTILKILTNVVLGIFLSIVIVNAFLSFFITPVLTYHSLAVSILMSICIGTIAIVYCLRCLGSCFGFPPVCASVNSMTSSGFVESAFGLTAVLGVLKVIHPTVSFATLFLLIVFIVVICQDALGLCTLFVNHVAWDELRAYLVANNQEQEILEVIDIFIQERVPNPTTTIYWYTADDAYDLLTDYQVSEQVIAFWVMFVPLFAKREQQRLNYGWICLWQAICCWICIGVRNILFKIGANRNVGLLCCGSCLYEPSKDSELEAINSSSKHERDDEKDTGDNKSIDGSGDMSGTSFPDESNVETIELCIGDDKAESHLDFEVSLSQYSYATHARGSEEVIDVVTI